MMMVMIVVNFPLLVATVYLEGVNFFLVVLGVVSFQVVLCLKEVKVIAHLKNHQEEVKDLMDLNLEGVLVVNCHLPILVNSLKNDCFCYHQSLSRLAEEKSLMNSFH